MEGFIYNQPVGGKNFVARRQEATELTELLRQGENVVIFEPPKRGKTSLINYALANLRAGSRKMTVVEQSLIRAREVEEAACLIGAAILKTVYPISGELAAAIPGLFKGTHFVFDPDGGSAGRCALGVSGELDETDVASLASLPCRVSLDENSRLIILLEEFQNIMECERGMWFCKMFEKHMGNPVTQTGATFSWLFCGSSYNAMREIFEVQKFFFFQVKRVRLTDATPKELVEFANKTFLSSGKVIDKELTADICERLKCNMWYVNHFCAICDRLSKGYIMAPVLEEGLSTLLCIHEPRFKATVNDLTTFQLHLLRAIIDGHRHFSSAETIKTYGLNSSANVRRLKDALCKKEIISFDEKDEPFFLDPLFEYWVTKYYFEIKK